MSVLVVANNAQDWPFQIANVNVVDSRTYLSKPEYSVLRGVKLFNLCRTYRYQSAGYYVSLLAEARGHRPLPSISTIQDLKTRSIVRLVSDELQELIMRSPAPIKSNRFELSIYFGRNVAKRYERLALHLFNQFQAPLLRALFVRERNVWQLRSIGAISASDVPESHWDFVVTAASEHFSGRRRGVKKCTQTRFDLAILWSNGGQEAPSDECAVRKFVKAAEDTGLNAEVITRDDYGRLAEFDALFIRDTTAVNHYTYRFARRAASEGLVVIDDPQSIVRCTNKVYLAELLTRHKVPMPRTIVVHRGNVDSIGDSLGFPCVLKKPDSAFSQGVYKVDSREEFETCLAEIFKESDLVVAQEFVPTTFDWRIGILDRCAIFASRYFMAHNHWQIVRRDENGQTRYGRLETIPVETVPKKAVQVALKAANLIGDGLYGVDVKQSDNEFRVMEVNDNPNIDAGCEDAILRDELYRRVMSLFLSRIEHRKSRQYA